MKILELNDVQILSCFTNVEQEFCPSKAHQPWKNRVFILTTDGCSQQKN